MTRSSTSSALLLIFVLHAASCSKVTVEPDLTSCVGKDLQAVVEEAVTVIERWDKGATQAELNDAVENLECAANMDNLSAQVLLGHFYQSGKVVEKDVQKSVSWFLVASESGHYEAMIPLFALYMSEITTYRVDDFFKIVEKHAASDSLGARFIIGATYCFDYYNDYDEDQCNAIVKPVLKEASDDEKEKRRLQAAMRHAGLYYALMFRLREIKENRETKEN